MLTLCQGTCPIDTANIVGAARRVTTAGLGAKVAFLSVTVDPGRDVAARLAAYRRQYAPAPSDWYVLTGSAREINLFWDTLGVFRKREADPSPGPKDWLTGSPARLRHHTFGRGVLLRPRRPGAVPAAGPATHLAG